MLCGYFYSSSYMFLAGKKLNPYICSFLHICPSCMEGKIYCGLLEVNEKCLKCDFALKKHDAGDGPAFFAMFFASVIVVLLSLFIDNIFMLPMWLHGALWTPLIIFLSIYFLRVTKSFLIYKQYQHNILKYRDNK